MKHARIINIPKNPKEIYDYALSKSYNHWVDEKGTKDHPSIWKRELSKFNYTAAFHMINMYKPHWVISFRNESYISPNLKDYWEFGGCNIGKNRYGEVFIWIQVDVGEALEIFKKFNLTVNEY